MECPRIQELFSARVWMSQLVCSIHWNLEEICSNASEGMHLTMRKRVKRQREQGSFFHVLYLGSQHEVWPKLKVYLPNLRTQIRNGTSTFKALNQGNKPHRCVQEFGFSLTPHIVNSTCKQIETKISNTSRKMNVQLQNRRVFCMSLKNTF